MAEAAPPIDADTPSLSAAFSAALDEAAQGGFDPRRADSPAARRLLGLLRLLDAPSRGASPPLSEDNSLLVDVTVARVLRTPRLPTLGRIEAPAPEPSLAAVRWDADASETGPVSALLALLDEGEFGASERHERSLVDATMRRIASDQESRRARFRMHPAPSEPGRVPGSVRLRDLASVAAAVLLGCAVLWPMLASSREHSRRTACAANLGRAALGFSMYAGDYDGALPSARASFFGGRWWDVGRGEASHSANLYRLITGHYNSLVELACPGNHGAPVRAESPAASDWSSPEQVSYSYQLFGARRPTWGAPARFVVLADKSPVIDRARRGERFDAEANSLNHSGGGQSLLFSDGSTVWASSPRLESGDNIWLPAPMEGSLRPTLTGREQPSGPTDAFVGP